MAVRQTIADAPGPLTAEDIHRQLFSTGIGIATVYRALKAGVDDGTLRPVEMPNSPTRYEPADRPHHHHFACQNCEQVFDIPGCPGNLDHLVPEGYVVQEHEILLKGLCSKCSEQEVNHS